LPHSNRQTGFTLIEIAIVVMIVSILLGYAVALLPKQRELRQYQQADREMDKIIDTIIGFAQVNGRLPCPSLAASAGIAAGGGTVDCTSFAGFVPSVTLGVQGRLDDGNLLSDPWGNPYRYYVSDADADGGGDSDFVINGQMQEIGLVDIVDIPNGDLSSDGYIDLDGQYVICSVQSLADATDDICANPADEVFGNAPITGGPYAGAPFVLISLGINGDDTPAANTDELENKGSTNLGGYMIKAAGETTFVKRPTGLADDFDDIVKWVSPNVLFGKMIEAYQLP
jgi:prepilin-type N-terminal cleavage/methylation domain-containing protein